jgi:hypothetical protein
MYQENVNQSRCRALRLFMTIATLLGAGGSTHLAALDTSQLSNPSPAPFDISVAVALQQGFFRAKHLGQVAGINLQRFAVVADGRFQSVTADSQRRPLRNL